MNDSQAMWFASPGNPHGYFYLTNRRPDHPRSPRRRARIRRFPRSVECPSPLVSFSTAGAWTVADTTEICSRRKGGECEYSKENAPTPRLDPSEQLHRRDPTCLVRQDGFAVTPFRQCAQPVQMLVNGNGFSNFGTHDRQGPNPQRRSW